MKLLVLFLSIILTVNAKNFIHNGKRATPGQFPSIVFVTAREYDMTFSCGGTLITRNFVLTAAHCVVRKDTINELRTDVTAHFGNVKTNEFKYKRTARNVIIHENYDHFDPSHIHDIGLIELALPAILSNNVAVASLPQRPPAPNALLDVVGWGRTEKNEGTNDLLYVTMPVMDQNTCAKYTSLEDPNSVVCIFNQFKQGICSGDSGGPFYLKDSDTVVGITSFSYNDEAGECDTTLPSMGTSVYYYLDWIDKHI